MPRIITARIGPTEHRATRPKLSSAAWRSLRMARYAHAQGHDERHGHGTGGNAAGTKATLKKSFGTKAARTNTTA